VVGIIAVLMPFCMLSIVLSWPLFTNALVTGEMSQNAGGLIRWPAYGLIPLGFSLLALQGLSELIKRIAFLTDQGPDALSHEVNKSDEEKHLEELEAIVARKLAEGK
jgi:TRAP-type mannitol/chloroaromatic compound transport system permease small subunit